MEIVPLLNRGVEGVHDDTDHFALAGFVQTEQWLQHKM
jgi:hypothetical protein